MNPKFKFALAVLSIAVLAGCSSFGRIESTVKRAEDSADSARISIDDLRNTRGTQRRNTVVFTDAPWVDTHAVVARKKEAPNALGCDVSFAPSSAVDLMEFAQWVTTICGLPVRVTPDALSAVSGLASAAEGNSGQGQGSSAGAAARPGVPPLPSLPSAGGVPARSIASTPTAGVRASQITDIRWSNKPVRGLLDVVTTKLGLNWKFVDGVVTIHYVDTKTFQFYAIPSATSTESVVTSGTTSASGVSGGSGAGGGGSGGSSSGIQGTSGSSQSTSIVSKTSITEDLEKNVKTMLTPTVGRMAMSSSTGTITVTDTPEVLARIGSYIAAENVRMTKQVLLNVKVLSVSLSDKDSLGLDWSVLYTSLSKNFGMALNTAFTGNIKGGSGSFAIAPTAGGEYQKFAGSSAIVKAIAEQGRVSVMTSPSVTTLNMQPVPVQVAKQTSYLASVQTTATASVGSTTSLTPGTVTTGFNMRVLPVVMNDNQLLLQFDVNLSALQQIRQVISGNSMIEIPEVDNRIFSQKVSLRSGETLVLSGFEQRVDQGNKQGLGHADNFLFGAQGTDNKHDVIVVLITPVLLD